MILTNNCGMPQPMYERIKADVLDNPYKTLESKLRSFRTTELIGHPFPIYLWNKYKDSDELVIDAKHFVTMMFGTAVHALCEGTDTEDNLYERKCSAKVTVDGVDYMVFGTVDEVAFIDGKVNVIDNKTILCSNLKYDKDDYIRQVNIYSYLLQNTFQELAGCLFNLKIRYFIKDFTPNWREKELAAVKDDYAIMLTGVAKARKVEYSYDACQKYILETLSAKDQARACIVKRDKTPERNAMLEWMPEASIHTVDVPYFGNEKTEAYIAERIRFHRDHQQEVCSEEYRFNNDSKCKFYCSSASVCPYAKSKGYV